VRLSIAIVNWNTTELLQALLRSIRAYAPSCDYEIICVDNNSQDFDAEAMRGEFPEVQFIINPDNAGYAKGNNQAFERATGDYILLLNPDTEVTMGALDTLVQFMFQHPDAAAAGGKLIRPDGCVDRSLRSFPHPEAIAWEYMGLSKLFPKSRSFARYRMTYFYYNETIEVDQPMGSCLIIKKETLEDVGPFDLSFPIFFNEVDWLYRAKQRKWKVFFVHNAVFVHHGAASTSQVDRKKMQVESHKSLLHFYEKHFEKVLVPTAYKFVTSCIRLSMRLKG
jgi:GT2 family glycosyltransferase